MVAFLASFACSQPEPALINHSTILTPAPDCEQEMAIMAGVTHRIPT
ncbi:MAG TPA: hypothetical protein VKV19_02435 [Ktedonobacteraceae bacterium]|nr:hypothetical protein [Ktedonobacteraceae bacterium]